VSAGSPAARRIAGGFVALFLFSALYTAGERFGIWPELPPGALRDLDLVVGAVAVAALALFLLLSRRGSA
jgi:hypothetical protein